MVNKVSDNHCLLCLHLSFVSFYVCFVLLRHFFYVALAVLELTLDQAGLELKEISLSLPPESWD